MIKITENPGDFWRRKILRSYKIRVIKIMILEQRDKKGQTNCPVEQNWDLEVDTHVWSIQCMTEEALHINGRKKGYFINRPENKMIIHVKNTWNCISISCHKPR